VGARTIKTGQSRWFVGYKKHTLRLWFAHYEPAVLLIPLVSWAAPANHNETNFVLPSLQRCAKRFGWVPQWTVGDMAYINLKAQRRLREELKVAFITRMRRDMRWVEPYTSDGLPRCPQGQPLSWLGFDQIDQQQWFAASAPQSLCSSCWQCHSCPREFAFPSAQHEILLGQVPYASWLAKHLCEKVRPWIEPAQSFEKHQLGLSDFFLNSLQLAWSSFLMADAVALLRAKALLSQPKIPPILSELAPIQLGFPWS
jgi:hypothetical protein